MSYSNYINSFYSNDVNVLQKRRKQAQKIGVATATVGAVAGGLALLPKNKVKLPCLATAVVMLLAAFNTHNYVKQTDAKIEKLNTKV